MSLLVLPALTPTPDIPMLVYALCVETVTTMLCSMYGGAARYPLCLSTLVGDNVLHHFEVCRSNLDEVCFDARVRLPTIPDSSVLRNRGKFYVCTDGATHPYPEARTFTRMQSDP